jgi:uncharacterized membrane protein
MQRIRSNFLTGLVLVAPVVLTLYLAWSAITFIDEKVVPWIPELYNPSIYLGQNIPGFGVLIFLIFTSIVGMITKGFFGVQLVKIWERLVEKTPVFRSVYSALKQIVETVLNQASSSFQKACLIEYPRKGVWAIAFIATETKGEVAAKIKNNGLITVFVPTTPNPTSGFLLFLPRKDVIVLDMNVESAAKLVVSAGLVTPPLKSINTKNLKKVN